MSSLIINRKFREEIRPLLKSANFNYSTGRIYWRFEKERTDVIRFQSFNSYLAERLRCTTYSFAILIGSYLTCVPDKYGSIKNKGDHLLPREYQCHFRGMAVKKQIKQPEFPREDIWYIDPDLHYLDSAIQDAFLSLKNYVLPWFEKFNNLQKVFDAVKTSDEKGEVLRDVWVEDQPYFTGFLALHIGERKLAAPYLKTAIESGHYQRALGELKQALENCST
jgi:hypothetical protein